MVEWACQWFASFQEEVVGVQVDLGTQPTELRGQGKRFVEGMLNTRDFPPFYLHLVRIGNAGQTLNG